MLIAAAVALAVILGLGSPAHADNASWPEGSARLLAQAQKQPAFSETQGLQPHYYPTRDGRSFIVVWQSGRTMPQKWIVSLHGTQGYATRDLTVWYPHLKGRDVGLITLQWWLGHGDNTQDYYSPPQIYREIEAIIHQLNIPPGSAMLHGFSRGSANIYAVAALDNTKGSHLFSLFVAHAGGAAPDYPPTRDIIQGAFGQNPFHETRWVTVCGERDPNPQRDGCPAMRRTAAWIQELGGRVDMTIEDPKSGHGALHLNPANASALLDRFLSRTR